MAEEECNDTNPSILPIVDFSKLNERAIMDIMMNHFSFVFNELTNLDEVPKEEAETDLENDNYCFKKVYEEKNTDEAKSFIFEQLQILVDKLSPLNNPKLNRYFMIALTSEMLYIATNDLFYNSLQLFAILGTIDYSSLALNTIISIKDCIREAFIAALAKYINGIGPARFIVEIPQELESNFNDFLKLALKSFYGKDMPHLSNTFFASLSENHFLNCAANQEKINEYTNDFFNFTDPEKFDFDNFSTIFTKLTGVDTNASNDFYDFLDSITQATDQTPLNFFHELTQQNVEVPLYPSSSPHAFEQLLIHQLATTLYLTKTEKVPETLDDYEEDMQADVQVDGEGRVINDSGEIVYKDQVNFYYQLFSVDGRKIEFPAACPPPEQDKPFNFLTDYKPTDGELPSDSQIRGSSAYPFFYDCSQKEEELRENLKNAVSLKILDGLGPIEQQLLRLLDLHSLSKTIETMPNFPAYDPDETDENVLKYQFDQRKLNIEMNLCIASIAYYLFPSTDLSMSEDSAKLFAMSVFAELYKLLKSAQINDQRTITDFNLGDIRRVFALAMESIIPAVYERLPELAQLSQNTPVNISFEQREHECLINPPSFRLYMRQLLFNPTARKECPVLYTYMANKERFVLVKHIPKIAPMIYRLWDAHRQFQIDTIDQTTFADIGVTKEEMVEFLTEWKAVATICLSDKLYVSLREKIDKSIENLDSICDLEPNDVPIRPFLPYAPREWPALHLLEFLSEAHNEFIRTLQKYSRLNVIEVDDRNIPRSFNYIIDFNNIDYYVLRSVRDKMQANCLPVFDKESEESFVKSLSQLTYCIIMHPAINLSGTVSTLITSQNLVTHFEETIGLISVTEEQKRQLSTYVKEERKDTGLKLLLNKFMFHIIDSPRGTFPLQTPLEKLFNTFTDSKLSALEQDGAAVLRVVQGKLDEPFQIGHIPSIYFFLQEPIDQSLLAETLQEAVIKNAKHHFGISPIDVYKIALHSYDVNNYRPFFTLIPKVIGGLAQSLATNEIDAIKKTKPTAIIQRWKQLNIAERSLTDKEEEKAIEMIAQWEKDDPSNGWNLSTLFSFFDDAKDNYK